PTAYALSRTFSRYVAISGGAGAVALTTPRSSAIGSAMFPMLDAFQAGRIVATDAPTWTRGARRITDSHPGGPRRESRRCYVSPRTSSARREPGRVAQGERPPHLGRLLGAPRLTELVRYSAVPSAKLAQKAPTPASAGRTSTLLEESEVEEQDGQRGDEKRRKPGLHDVPLSRGRRRPSTGASYFGR